MYLIKRLGVFVETAMGFFQAVVDGIEGCFDGVLKFGKGYSSLIRIYKEVEQSVSP